jgi:hypothetical protein
MPMRPSPSADHGQRREAQRAAALDDLGHAVHRDHLFLQAVVVAFGLGARLKLAICLS